VTATAHAKERGVLTQGKRRRRRTTCSCVGRAAEKKKKRGSTWLLALTCPGEEKRKKGKKGDHCASGPRGGKTSLKPKTDEERGFRSLSNGKERKKNPTRKPTHREGKTKRGDSGKVGERGEKKGIVIISKGGGEKGSFLEASGGENKAAQDHMEKAPKRLSVGRKGKRGGDPSVRAKTGKKGGSFPLTGGGRKGTTRPGQERGGKKKKLWPFQFGE